VHRVRAASNAASTMVISYRQDCAKRKLSVLNLVTGQKSGFLPHRSDSLHQFSETWQC